MFESILKGAFVLFYIAWEGIALAVALVTFPAAVLILLFLILLVLATN